MDLADIRYRLSDGSYHVAVAELDGALYHVTTEDPLFEAVDALAAGLALPAPPVPPPIEARRMVPLQAVMARLQLLGQLEAVRVVLNANPPARALFLSIESGIYADDPQARAVLSAAGCDPDVILA